MMRQEVPTIASGIAHMESTQSAARKPANSTAVLHANQFEEAARMAGA